jgi:hypothetical protein
VRPQDSRRSRTSEVAERYPLTSELDNVLGLESFRALDHFELHFLIFLERFETLPLDGGMMHKDISAIFLGNEAIAFSVIKPFYLTLHLHVENILLIIAFLPAAAPT